MSRVVRYVPLDELRDCPVDLDKCDHFDFSDYDNEGSIRNPFAIDHLYYSPSGQWIEMTMRQVDGEGVKWADQFEEIKPLDAVRIFLERFGRIPAELQPKTKAPAALPELVTLDQAAAAVHRKKRTLERRKTKGTLPSPIVEGGGGKPDLWDWSLIRPWLQSEFGVILPERFFATPQ